MIAKRIFLFSTIVFFPLAIFLTSLDFFSSKNLSSGALLPILFIVFIGVGVTSALEIFNRYQNPKPIIILGASFMMLEYSIYLLYTGFLFDSINFVERHPSVLGIAFGLLVSGLVGVSFNGFQRLFKKINRKKITFLNLSIFVLLNLLRYLNFGKSTVDTINPNALEINITANSFVVGALFFLVFISIEALILLKIMKLDFSRSQILLMANVIFFYLYVLFFIMDIVGVFIDFKV